MAREINDINKTVCTAELVETIMHKLGITRTIEELLESYNMTLPLGFPVFLMNVEPLLNSEDRSKYPECARMYTSRGEMFLLVCFRNTNIWYYQRESALTVGNEWLFFIILHRLGLGIVCVEEPGL